VSPATHTTRNISIKFELPTSFHLPAANMYETEVCNKNVSGVLQKVTATQQLPDSKILISIPYSQSK